MGKKNILVVAIIFLFIGMSFNLSSAAENVTKSSKPISNGNILQVDGFGKISEDNKRIITIEWIAAGLTLCFIGIISFIFTYLGYSGDVVSILVYRLFAIMLIVLAVVSIFTGARTSILPNKFCPLIMTIVSILFLLGTIL